VGTTNAVVKVKIHRMPVGLRGQLPDGGTVQPGAALRLVRGEPCLCADLRGSLLDPDHPAVRKLIDRARRPTGLLITTARADCSCRRRGYPWSPGCSVTLGGGCSTGQLHFSVAPPPTTPKPPLAVDGPALLRPTPKSHLAYSPFRSSPQIARFFDGLLLVPPPLLGRAAVDHVQLPVGRRDVQWPTATARAGFYCALGAEALNMEETSIKPTARGTGIDRPRWPGSVRRCEGSMRSPFRSAAVGQGRLGAHARGRRCGHRVWYSNRKRLGVL